MDPNVLREHLSKLHEELAAARQVDPGSAALLTDIMNDIKRLTERPSADPGGAAPLAAAPLSLPRRLERIAVEFEAQHPTLAASSRRLVDLLGKAGL